jgi:hypothetical protein
VSYGSENEMIGFWRYVFSFAFLSFFDDNVIYGLNIFVDLFIPKFLSLSYFFCFIG